ncbi:hypothetical protein CC77DRAFT_949254, partial [Alternaria alternata]
PVTYDHRTLKIRLPVRSAIYKQCTGGLVVRWVTTSESPLLYVFAPFCSSQGKDGESVLDRGGLLHKASTGVIEDEAGNCFTFCILADVLGTEDLSFFVYRENRR